MYVLQKKKFPHWINLKFLRPIGNGVVTLQHYGKQKFTCRFASRSHLVAGRSGHDYGADHFGWHYPFNRLRPFNYRVETVTWFYSAAYRNRLADRFWHIPADRAIQAP